MIAPHISGITITHLQEHKTTVTTASGNQHFHDSKRQQYGVMVTRCCIYSWFVLRKMGDSDTRNMQSNHQIKISSVTCESCWDFYIRILLRCTDPCILNILNLVKNSVDISKRKLSSYHIKLLVQRPKPTVTVMSV